jgi:hypothetical protein
MNEIVMGFKHSKTKGRKAYLEGTLWHVGLLLLLPVISSDLIRCPFKIRWDRGVFQITSFCKEKKKERKSNNASQDRKKWTWSCPSSN